MNRFTVAWAVALALPILGSSAAAQTQIGDKVTINGYSSFEFERQLGDDGEGDPNGSFDADLFDLVINVQATDRLRVASDITWEHGSASEDGRGNVAVEYAFAEYRVKDWLKVRAGKMFTHFGIYNEIHTAKPTFLTVKEPLSTNKNDKFGSEHRFYPRWLTGVSVGGNFAVSSTDFEYIVQLSNGEQETTNPFEEDDNAQKAVSGRLRLTPSPNFVLGASFYTDSITELDGAGEDLGTRTRLTSYGVHAEWTPRPFGFELELVRGSINPSVATGTDRDALTVMLFRTFGERVTPYFRYEYLDPSDLSDDEASMYVYGFNIRIDQGLFIKAELNTVNAGAGNLHFNGVDYSEFKAALAVGF